MISSVEKLTNPTGNNRGLPPELRKRLLNESRHPFGGLRRLLWGALFGSAFIGFLIMATRSITGESVLLSDLGIQVGALALFGGLLFLDRKKISVANSDRKDSES